MSRGCVYTINLGEKDDIKPVIAEENCDYIVFSDNPDQVLSYPWNLYLVHEDHFFKNLSVRQRARQLKVLQQFKDGASPLEKYEWNLCIDASITLLVSPSAIAQLELRQHDLALYQHPWRNCIYEEAHEVLLQNKEHQERIKEAIRILRETKYPVQLGLATTMLIVRRNNPFVSVFNKCWWANYLTLSQRDQLSFDFTIWQLGANYEKISGCPYDGSKYTRHTHIGYHQDWPHEATHIHCIRR